MEDINDELSGNINARRDSSEGDNERVIEKVFVSGKPGDSTAEKLVETLKETGDVLEKLSDKFKDDDVEDEEVEDDYKRSRVIQRPRSKMSPFSGLNSFAFRRRREMKLYIIGLVAAIALAIPLGMYMTTSDMFFSPLTVPVMFHVNDIQIKAASNGTNIQAQVSEISVYGSDKLTADANSLIFLKSFNRHAENITNIEDAVQDYINHGSFYYLSMVVVVEFDSVYETKIMELENEGMTIIYCDLLS